MNFLKKLFDHEYKELKRFSDIADKIDALSDEYSKMSDYELKAKLKAINENKQYYKDGRIESKKNTDKEEKEKNEDVKSQSNKENEEEKNGILSYRKTYEGIIKNSKTKKNSVLKQEDKLKETAIEKKIIKNKTTSSISLPDMSVSEELQNLLEIKSSLVVLTENVIKSSKHTVFFKIA